MPNFALSLALVACSLFMPSSLAAPAPAPASITSLYSWIQQHQQPAPALPPSSLPAPNPAWSIKYVAVGMGTQNYTCASSSATPVAGGAVANLYDATLLMRTQGVIGSVSQSSLSCIMDATNNNLGLTQIGQHYFNGNGVPTFDLTKAGKGEWLSSTKVAAQNADSTACTGRDGNTAVPWLYLQQDGTGRSSGLSAVYRMVTTGGNGNTCSDVSGGWVERDYAALYYFYG